MISRHRQIGIAAALALATAWAYAPIFRPVVQRWSSDPEYSHGFLVPLMAAGILWFRREKLSEALRDGPSWWGLALLTVAAGMYLTGTAFYFHWLAQISLLVVVAALC